MRNKRLIITLAALAAVVGILVYWPRRALEPVFQGKTLSVWLDQYGSNHWSNNRQLDREAEDALHHFGTNQIPVYLKMLSTHSSFIKTNILAHISPAWLAWLHLPTVNQYEADLELRRNRGSYGLIALGENAKPAVPELIDRLNDSQAHVRYQSVFTIRWLGPVARDALPSLIKCLNDPRFNVRSESIIALGTIHEDPEHVVPLLLNILKTNNSNQILRGVAVEAIDQFDTQAAAAVPALSQALSDPDVNYRLVVIRALGKIHGQPDVGVPALTANLAREKKESLNNLHFTFVALGQYGPDARSAVPTITSFANDTNLPVRPAALWSLKHIDPDAAARAEAK
jgi:hypothetical protein